MKVVITSNAEGELRNIALHIEQDSPASAEALVRTLRNRCLALADLPLRGMAIGRRRGLDMRRLVEGEYLIINSVSADCVRIHRVVHGARSPRMLLKGLDLR